MADATTRDWDVNEGLTTGGMDDLLYKVSLTPVMLEWGLLEQKWEMPPGWTILNALNLGFQPVLAWQMNTLVNFQLIYC